MYFMGILIIFIGALLVNRITGNSRKKSYFIIELPEYKIPNFWRAVKSMCSRGWAYIVKAATIILLCNTAVQIMQSFGWNFAPADADSSILASIARPFAYLLVPVIGYHAWQLAAATITGFIAKENVVATIAVCYALVDVTGDLPSATPELTGVAALAFLMLNLFSPPCFAAMGAMNSEMKSAKWFWSGIGLQLGVGYTAGYLVYTVGTLITAPETLNVVAAIGGGVAVLVFFGVLTYLCVKPVKNITVNKEKIING